MEVLFVCKQEGIIIQKDTEKLLFSKVLVQAGCLAMNRDLYHMPSPRLMGQKDGKGQKSGRPEQNSVFQT